MSRHILLSGIISSMCFFILADYLIAGRFPVPPETKGTIGLYHFEGDAKDAAGNRNDGAIESAAFTAGKQWQGLEFNFTHAVRIAIPQALPIIDEFTFEAWIRQTDRRFVPMKIFETTNGEISLIANANGTLSFSYQPVNGDIQTIRSEGEYGAIYLNKWQCIAATIGKGFMALYIDGHETNRKILSPESAQIKPISGDFIIGNDKSMQSGFIGIMDEVRIARDWSPTIPPLEVLLNSFPSKRSLIVQANAIGTLVPDNQLSGKADLLDSEGNLLQSAALGPFEKGVAAGELSTASLREGEYPVVVRVMETNTSKELVKEVATFTKLTDNPPWKGLLKQIIQHVPPPWSPPQISGTNLICWGREYRYTSSSPFPSEIINQNESILNGAIKLTGTANGQVIQWNVSENRVINKTETVITLESNTPSQYINLKAITTFEYDGFMKIELTFIPSQPVDIQSLQFQIPLKKEFARYYHYCPDVWTFDVRNAGLLPNEGWGDFFKPYLWLGNEDIGLAWCSESYRGWSIDKNKTAVEARPEGNDMVARISVVNRPVRWDKPVTVVFGLQATPAKPLPAGSRSWRYGAGEGVTIVHQTSDAKYGEWYHFPTPRDIKKYNEMIDREFHSKGQMFTMYSDHYYPSVQLPEFQYYRGDWYVNSGCWAQGDVIRYGQPCLSVCMREDAWMDYHISLFVDYWKSTIADGIYIDGVIPIYCQNPTHQQCYFIDQDGERVYEYQIFACREMMKAIYCVSREYNPLKIIISHMSTRLVSPILTFTDAYVDGEQFIAGERFNGDYIATMHPDKIIAEFMGRQYGLVDFFLAIFREEQRTESNYRNLVTLLLLHDTSIWWGGYWWHVAKEDIMHKTWRVLDDFGIGDAEFVPYWKINQYKSKVTGDNILASAYYRQGKEILLVVGNLGSSPVAGTITGDPKEFGIYGDIKITDAFSGESIPISGESISVTIPAKDFRLLRIKGN